MRLVDIREGKQSMGMFLAWDIAIPAAIGSIPMLAFMTVDPPPYSSWDSAGYLLFLIMFVTGSVAGLLGLRHGSVFIAIAVSFWIAQSVGGWFAVCGDITSSASCGPSNGATGLVFAAVLSLILGVAPLLTVYWISSLVVRPDPSA